MGTKRKELPVFANEKCSEYFYQHFAHAGAHGRTDCHCGRVHFENTDDDAYQKGEYKKLLALHKKNPKKYIMYDSGTAVSLGTIFGRQTVSDCPCNYARFAEDMITEYRYQIIDYFTGVTKAKLKRAKKEKEALKELELLAGELSQLV